MSTNEFIILSIIGSGIAASILFTAIINTVIHSIIERYVYELREVLWDVSSVLMVGVLLYVCILYVPRTYHYLLRCSQIPF